MNETNLMTITEFATYLKTTLLSNYGQYIYNGVVNRDQETSIGVLFAPSTRGGGQIMAGGLDCTTVMMLPLNVLVRWTGNTDTFAQVANEVYFKLLSFTPGTMINETRRVASVDVLDGGLVGVGRDDNNICEGMIRINVMYYL
jgi:hypothetical protein